MKNFLCKLLLLNLLFFGSGLAQEAFFASEVSGVSLSALYASGKDYKSKGFAAMLIHKGKFFLGYEHDAAQIWLKEDDGDYHYKVEQNWDAVYLGVRNFEKPQRKQYLSFTFQTGFAFSTPDEGVIMRMIPVTVTFFKQLSGKNVKIVPLIYGTYAYAFISHQGWKYQTDVETDYAYGVQLNVVLRPISGLNHGLAFGLDFNLKNRDVPLSFQFSLVFNAFKSNDK